MPYFEAPGGTTFQFPETLIGDLLCIAPNEPFISPLSDVVALVEHWRQKYPEALARIMPAVDDVPTVLLLGSDPRVPKGSGW